MDGLHVCLLILLGTFSSSQLWTYGSVLDMIVSQGDNISLHCDLRSKPGVYIVWYRNCSHENQPSLVLRTKYEPVFYEADHQADVLDSVFLNPFPHLHLVKNDSSQSYDLLITNISDSNVGLYYCGTEKITFKSVSKLTPGCIYTYSNIKTRIQIAHNKQSDSRTTQDKCYQCWTLLFPLCPVIAIASSLLSSLLMYRCQKTAKAPLHDVNRPDNRDQTRRNQDEDVCYAAVEIHPAPQRPRKKKVRRSDFSTYSAINTCRM